MQFSLNLSFTCRLKTCFKNLIFTFSERPLELPLFEIRPNRSQVVFEGDKIPFECRASVVDPETKILWLREGHIVISNRY